MPASTQAFASLLGVYFVVVIATAAGRPNHHTGPDEVFVVKSTGLRIDPNTADAATLELLPGVGPGIAEHIIEAREAGLVFRSADDLRAVKFIGPSVTRRVGPWVAYARESNPVKQAPRSIAEAGRGFE